MEKKIVTIKTLQYEKMYKMFYQDHRNVEMSRHCFFSKKDIVNKIRAV